MTPVMTLREMGSFMRFSKRMPLAALMAVLLLCLGGLALADDPVTDWGPDPMFSSVIMANGGEAVSLFVTPDGSGRALTEAYAFGGYSVDATVTATLVDYGGMPITNFPAEDMWLEPTTDGLVLCVGGSVADGNTDSSGRAYWSGPILAGGSNNEGCWVMINGSPLTSGTLPLQFNSADLTGDLAVGLSDVVVFTQDFFGDYNYRSDFCWDGTLNLSDLTMLAGAVGAQCP